MFPYIVVFISTGMLLIIAHNFSVRQQQYVASFCLIVISIFAGLRGYVGIDTYMYHSLFFMIRSMNFLEALSKMEPLFVLLIKFSSFFSGNSFVFSGLVTALQGILLFILLMTSKDPTAFLALYIATFYLGFEFNILRAGTAILFLILASRSVRNLSGKNFYLYSILAFISHYSSLLGFLPMFIHREKDRGSTKLFITTFFILIILIIFMFRNYDLFSFKYANYFLLDLHAVTKPSIIGLVIRILIYTVLFSLVITKNNFGFLTILFSFWLIARLLTIEFIIIDRVEIIFSALFLFYIIEHKPAGSFGQLHTATLAIFLLLGFYSSFKGVSLTEAEISRGTTIIDTEHSSSPYIPYKFSWEETGQ